MEDVWRAGGLLKHIGLLHSDAVALAETQSEQGLGDLMAHRTLSMPWQARSLNSCIPI